MHGLVKAEPRRVRSAERKAKSTKMCRGVIYYAQRRGNPLWLPKSGQARGPAPMITFIIITG
jgi:hypothetical protein